jgi:hypothetical protein
MEGFSKKTKEWCERQHYTREGQATEVEFSQVAHRIFGTFFINTMTLEEIVEVANCMILARLRPKPEAPKEEPTVENGGYTFIEDAAPDTICGEKGVPHRMKRWSCYDTQCINPGCNHKI